MKQKFNLKVSTEVVEQVLEGAYNDDENAKLIKIMKLVLNSYVRITPTEKVSPTIIVQQLRGKIKVWRESTTASPSRLHLLTNPLN